MAALCSYIVVVIIFWAALPAGAIKVLNPAPTGEAYQRAEPVKIAVVELPRAAPAKSACVSILQGRVMVAPPRGRGVATHRNAGNGVFIAAGQA